MKTQNVRLLDVFAFGPFMIYAAYKAKLLPFERGILALIGAGTIVYNWQNYVEQRQIESQQ